MSCKRIDEYTRSGAPNPDDVFPTRRTGDGLSIRCIHQRFDISAMLKHHDTVIVIETKRDVNSECRWLGKVMGSDEGVERAEMQG